MNLLTLRSQARLKSSVNATDYSNANLDVQLNEGYYKLANILVYLNEGFFEEQHVKFNLGLNSGLYSLPTDFLKMTQVRLAYTTPTNPEDYTIANHYDPTDIHDIGADEENISTNNPMVDITNNYFRVKPTPSSAVTNGGELYYIARPSALTLTGDTPVLPNEYHDLIATYGAREMAMKYNKEKKWTMLNRVWDTEISRLQELMADRELNKQVSMKSPYTYVRDRNVREL